MVNTQEYINQQYPNKEERKKIIELDISNQNLEGELDLSDFLNLQELNCSNNQLTKLSVVNCPKLEMLACHDNLLTNIDLSNNLKLEMLNVGDNNFSEQDLSFLEHLVNLEVIVLGNKNGKKIKNNAYNRFTGSLEPLENMNKLECLDIRNTDISDGLEHLPESLEEFVCSTKERPNSKVRKIYDLFADGKGSAEVDDYGLIKNFREKVKKIKKDNLERIKGEKREKIDQILKQRKESNKNMVN